MSLFFKMSPLTVPRAKSERDTLLVVSPLRLHQGTRQRYKIKTEQELIYVHFQLFSLELHPRTSNGAIKCVVSIFSSKMCCLLEQVVCASFFLPYALMEKSGPPANRGTPAFHYGRSSREIQKSLVEAALQHLSL